MCDRLSKMLQNKLNNNNYDGNLNSFSITSSLSDNNYNLSSVKNFKNKMFDNNNNLRYLRYFIILFLTLYGGLAAVELPKSTAKMFENELFKFVYLILLIVVFFNKEWTVGILLSLIFMLCFRSSSIHRINKFTEDQVNYMTFKKQYIDSTNLNHNDYLINHHNKDNYSNNINENNDDNNNNDLNDNYLLNDDKYASFN